MSPSVVSLPAAQPQVADSKLILLYRNILQLRDTIVSDRHSSLHIPETVKEQFKALPLPVPASAVLDGTYDIAHSTPRIVSTVAGVSSKTSTTGKDIATTVPAQTFSSSAFQNQSVSADATAKLTNGHKTSSSLPARSAHAVQTATFGQSSAVVASEQTAFNASLRAARQRIEQELRESDRRARHRHHDDSPLAALAEIHQRALEITRPVAYGGPQTLPQTNATALSVPAKPSTHSSFDTNDYYSSQVNELSSDDDHVVTASAAAAVTATAAAAATTAGKVIVTVHPAPSTTKTASTFLQGSGATKASAIDLNDYVQASPVIPNSAEDADADDESDYDPAGALDDTRDASEGSVEDGEIDEEHDSDYVPALPELASRHHDVDVRDITLDTAPSARAEPPVSNAKPKTKSTTQGSAKKKNKKERRAARELLKASVSGLPSSDDAPKELFTQRKEKREKRNHNKRELLKGTKRKEAPAQEEKDAKRRKREEKRAARWARKQDNTTRLKPPVSATSTQPIVLEDTSEHEPRAKRSKRAAVNEAPVYIKPEPVSSPPSISMRALPTGASPLQPMSTIGYKTPSHGVPPAARQAGDLRRIASMNSMHPQMQPRSAAPISPMTRDPRPLSSQYEPRLVHNAGFASPRTPSYQPSTPYFTPPSQPTRKTVVDQHGNVYYAVVPTEQAIYLSSSAPQYAQSTPDPRITQATFESRGPPPRYYDAPQYQGSPSMAPPPRVYPVQYAGEVSGLSSVHGERHGSPGYMDSRMSGGHSPRVPASYAMPQSVGRQTRAGSVMQATPGPVYFAPHQREIIYLDSNGHEIPPPGARSSMTAAPRNAIQYPPPRPMPVAQGFAREGSVRYTMESSAPRPMMHSRQVSVAPDGYGSASRYGFQAHIPPEQRIHRGYEVSGGGEWSDVPNQYQHARP